jgi:capsular exopolysaccharide synthesis family protein
MSAKRPLEQEVSLSLSELSTLPSKERALLDISRQQTIKNAIYTFLLQKREESAISFAATLSDIRILEPAKGMSNPVSPKRPIIWLAAFILGLAIPAGLVVLKERLNSKVLFRSDIEKLVKLPIIGEIYQTKMNETDLVFVENSRSVMAESIRSVRTKLPFYFTREDEKLLLISSSVPGEGKSFMAANIGLSISMMGKKTLIIGGDMRKPKLHKSFGISNAIGLSTYLIGKCTTEETIVATEHENLFVLPSGPIPPNPSELLVQDRWLKLIEELKVQFDFIVLDTPPLGLISDAELMAKQADLSLFVVRHDHSPKEAVKKVLGTQDFANRFPRAVLVFNGLKQRGIGYYGYGYGYGYDYGYGGYSYGGYAYGSESKKTPLLKKLKKRIRIIFK